MKSRVTVRSLGDPGINECSPGTARQRHDAVAQRQQRAVDVRALEAARAQVGALRARQVDQEQPAAVRAALTAVRHCHAAEKEG